MEARIYKEAWDRMFNTSGPKIQKQMDEILNKTARDELDNQEFQNLPKGDQ